MGYALDRQDRWGGRLFTLLLNYRNLAWTAGFEVFIADSAVRAPQHPAYAGGGGFGIR